MKNGDVTEDSFWGDFTACTGFSIPTTAEMMEGLKKAKEIGLQMRESEALLDMELNVCPGTAKLLFSLYGDSLRSMTGPEIEKAVNRCQQLAFEEHWQQTLLRQNMWLGSNPGEAG